MPRVDVLNVGRFAPPRAPAELFNTPSTVQEKDALVDGDLVEWKGVRFKWTSRHHHASTLESWRAVGDDVADAALEAANHFKRQRSRSDTTEGGSGCPFSSDNLGCVQEAARNGDRAASTLLAEASTVPSYVDWSRVRRGQQFFLRNLAGAGSALLFVSLVGGFGAPRINKVLSSTGYLTTPSKHTYRRLFETIQMVIDCMEEGSLVPGGTGWEAVLRVRLLHSAVRTRLRTQPGWNEEAWGVPINQEDLLVTQLAFSQLVLVSLERMAVRMCDQDLEDYIHLWRLIGQLMGVSPQLGEALTSVREAEAMLESVMLHLVEPDPTSGFIARNVLESVALYSPTKYSVEHMASMCRRMLGETYADALGIPPGQGTLYGWSVVQWRINNIRMASFLAHLPFFGQLVTDFMHWGLKALIVKMYELKLGLDLGFDGFHSALGERTNFMLLRSPSYQLLEATEEQAKAFSPKRVRNFSKSQEDGGGYPSDPPESGGVKLLLSPVPGFGLGNAMQRCWSGRFKSKP